MRQWQSGWEKERTGCRKWNVNHQKRRDDCCSPEITNAANETLGEEDL